jgi:hypothetical protein
LIRDLRGVFMVGAGSGFAAFVPSDGPVAATELDVPPAPVPPAPESGPSA